MASRASYTIPKRPGPRRDEGFFGPDALAWEIVRHPVVLVGGLRNAAYTALLSGVAQAVYDHSKHMIDPITRAKETAYWVYASIFADTVEAHRAGKWVEGLHRKATGYDPVTRSDYSPLLPHLAIAGHCLIWDSQLVAYETYVRKLSDAEREQYWQEGLRIPPLLGIDSTIIPQTYADWQRYYSEQIRPSLAFSVAGHAIVDFTYGVRWAPIWARPFAWAVFTALEELTLPTLGPVELNAYGKKRSSARLALTQALGRPIAKVAAAPRVRHWIELWLGKRIHELMTEAREIERAHWRDRQRVSPGAVA